MKTLENITAEFLKPPEVIRAAMTRLKISPYMTAGTVDYYSPADVEKLRSDLGILATDEALHIRPAQ